MRIGILTFHRALNYGAVLQCYALYQVLKEMGHNIEVIDYRPSAIEKYRIFLSNLEIKKRKGCFNKLKYLISSSLSFYQRKKVSTVFDNFLRSNFQISPVVQDMNGIPQYYDVIILGSDQIWSKGICNGLDLVYWGQFKHTNTRLITYAASIGNHNIISDSELMCMKEYIQSFDDISVREESLKKFLKQSFNVDSTLVIDPTLLITHEVFDRLAIKPKVDRYVLLFTLEKDNNAVAFAKNMSRQLSCPIVRLSAIHSAFSSTGNVIKAFGVSPEEFCGYIKYATCTICISFHGTAFSVIYRKNFYCLKSAQQDRSYNLLSSIGLLDRMVNSNDKVDFTPIEYSKVNEKINKLRKSSLKFLNNTL